MPLFMKYYILYYTNTTTNISFKCSLKRGSEKFVACSFAEVVNLIQCSFMTVSIDGGSELDSL